MIDYPGKLSSIIFLPNCNFRCPYCHNPELVLDAEQLPDINIDDILRYLKSKRKWIDGVCITGGEPTLTPNIDELCRILKSSGFSVKFDTNGTNPQILKELIKQKLIDFVAMDIKGPIERYDEIVMVNVNKDNIKESVKIIRESGLDYEFRTTILPKLIKEDDLIAIGKWLKGSKTYVLQQFRPNITLDKSYGNEVPYTEKEMKRFGDLLKPYFEKVEVRV